MLKYIGIFIVGILTSFYFFPIEFTFLRGVNTKMAMAGFGVIVLALQMARGMKAQMDKMLFSLSIIAMIVSLFALVAVTYNETNDYTYATYIVSMWVWLSGAYIVVSCMRAWHGYVSVELVCKYLIGVCVAQCISALLIDSFPSYKNLVDTYVSGFGFVDVSKIEKVKRLYGIGAGLDVAGLRFSAVLVAIAYLCNRVVGRHKSMHMILYLLAFIFIGLVGNMIARTTTVGIILALVYWLLGSVALDKAHKCENRQIWKSLAIVLILTLPIIVWQYYSNMDSRMNIRFAFEGFFSLAEKGEWDVSSNRILINMIKFPNSLKTWLIGDGYIENPRIDPYYTGKIYPGFYMDTDIGYLRFIFYFGVFGLLSFIYFFVACTRACIERLGEHKWLFLIILAVNLTGWLKVSTDIFLVFALFLCIPPEEKEKHVTYRAKQ